MPVPFSRKVTAGRLVVVIVGSSAPAALVTLTVTSSLATLDLSSRASTVTRYSLSWSASAGNS